MDWNIEEWRPVRSLRAVDASSHGNIRTWRRGQRPWVINQSPGQYLKVRINGKVYSVHRLVLEAFYGPCPEGKEGSHINGDPYDNRAENLVWETHAENMARSVTTGSPTLRPGEAPPKRRRYASTAMVDEVRELAASGVRQIDIAKRLGLSKFTVNRIVRGHSHR